MNTTEAVLADPSRAERLRITTVAAPAPAPEEAVIAVHAFSLNPGEVRKALTSGEMWRPGWDVAGVVAQAAADGSGPPEGARVVGFAGIAGGGWARKVAIPVGLLAVIDPDVAFAQAACLPVAGLTAKYALEKKRDLEGATVLVTGASGGVGWLACQLALTAGAHVTAVTRTADGQRRLAEVGVTSFLTGPVESPVRYDLILESVGGDSLAWSLSHLEMDGVCVLYGSSSAAPTTFDPATFFLPGLTTLRGLYLGTEVEHRRVSDDLGELAALVAARQLSVPVAHEKPWSDIAAVAAAFDRREITGKVVMHIDV